MGSVDDRRVLNGIFWVLRSGASWRDLPKRYGPRTTCYNRFNRRREAGVWDRLMDAISAAHDREIQMIDSTSIRAHQQAATAKERARSLSRSQSRRAHDQDPRHRRCARPPDPARPGSRASIGWLRGLGQDGQASGSCSCRTPILVNESGWSAPRNQTLVQVLLFGLRLAESSPAAFR
jgi:transposase